MYSQCVWLRFCTRRHSGLFIIRKNTGLLFRTTFVTYYSGKHADQKSRRRTRHHEKRIGALGFLYESRKYSVFFSSVFCMVFVHPPRLLGLYRKEELWIVFFLETNRRTSLTHAPAFIWFGTALAGRN